VTRSLLRSTLCTRNVTTIAPNPLVTRCPLCLCQNHHQPIALTLPVEHTSWIAPLGKPFTLRHPLQHPLHILRSLLGLHTTPSHPVSSRNCPSPILQNGMLCLLTGRTYRRLLTGILTAATPSLLALPTMPYTVHISHELSDFFALHRLPPCPVRGIGGSQVSAIGISSIKLRIGRGLHITLHHVLFVPSAAVCLVSVSSLCSADTYTTHFDAKSCWVSTKAGVCVLTGNLTSCCLYRVSGTNLQARHQCTSSITETVPDGLHDVLYSTPVPTLGVWHRRLTHANIRSVSIWHVLVTSPVCMLTSLPCLPNVTIVFSANRLNHLFQRSERVHVPHRSWALYM